MKTLLCLIFLATTLFAGAQTEGGTGVPPAFEPLLRQILKTKTPAQWLEAIQKASPTAWKMVQQRAKEPQPKSFVLADFEALPEKERDALLETFTPIVTESIGSLTAQEQWALLSSAKDFTPDQVISPIFNQAIGLKK